MTEERDDQTDTAKIFVGLLIEHEPMVRAFLRGLVPTWNDVDEVIQNASLVAWRKFGDFEQGTTFGGWFLTIARFEALKHRTKMARSPLVFVEHLWETLADEAEGDSSVLTPLLEVCLQKLEPGKRKLILKVYSPGAVMREIAPSTGKSEQALYKIIQRLRRVLLECVNRLRTETIG